MISVQLQRTVPIGDSTMLTAWGKYMTINNIKMETQGLTLPDKWEQTWDNKIRLNVKTQLTNKEVIGETVFILMNTAPNHDKTAPNKIAENVKQLARVLSERFKTLKVMLDVPDNSAGWNPYYDSVNNAVRRMWVQILGLTGIHAPHLKGVDLKTGGPPRTITGCLTIEAATFHLGQALSDKEYSRKRKPDQQSYQHPSEKKRSYTEAPRKQTSNSTPATRTNTSSQSLSGLGETGNLIQTINTLVQNNQEAWAKVAELQLKIGQLRPDTSALQMLVAQNISMMVMPRFSVVAAKLDTLERQLHTVVAEVPYGTQITEETVAPMVDDSETKIDNDRETDTDQGAVQQEQGDDTLSVLEDLHHFADQAMEAMESDAGDCNIEEDKLLQDDVGNT